jgi:hypothetical protein
LSDKGLLINAIDLVEIDRSTNIPTALYYRKGQAPAIGSEALELKQARRELNEDFKIDLGNTKPGTSAPRRAYTTAAGDKKSAAELTADFIHELLLRVTKWMDQRELKVAPSIMVAEPLSMLTEAVGPARLRTDEYPEVQQGELVTKDWLQHYRSNLKRILLGKGFDEDRIKFLPEPFAVFQYYRHAKKHPLVADKRQHNALVIDFGGGTFDACIIETTKEGEIDINDARRLSKARSAASRPIGGFFVNRSLLEALLQKYLAPQNLIAKLTTGIDLYRRWRRNDISLAGISEEQKYFIQYFHLLSHEIEDAKLTLSRSITDWRLEAPLALSVPVAIQANPFAVSPMINCQLSATEFREVFIKRVWLRELKEVVQKVLERGKDELNGAPITVVLLSGGSANIKWLRELLKRDFRAELAHAEVLELKDYQEVVSKGLAVECVRRFYDPEGDFASTTYNRLCLILDPDDSGFRLKPFHSKKSGLPESNIAGVLVPSSSALSKFMGEPMRWKVRLEKNPSQRLDYYFLRSSFSPNEVESLQNVEEHTVYTPKNCKFDANLQIELTVNPDGTAIPRFIYKTGRDESETIATDGRPFFLDTTVGQPEVFPEAYIGLDFGTSNTSVSFVSQASIEIYEKRAQEKFWNDLSGLTSSLPYPLAAPLAKYLRADPGKLMSAAREFTEAALTLAAYLAYLEYCVRKGRGASYLFKGFTQRSAGPLWSLFRESMRNAGKGMVLCAPLKELTEAPLVGPVDRFVTEIAKEKHGKIDEGDIDTVRPVQILANILQKVFTDSKFGLFQHVQKPRFGKAFHGLFRHAIGRPPFVVVSEYVGETSFSQDEAFVVLGTLGMPLQPLIFWNRCIHHPELDGGHCYLFDCLESPGVFSFKAVGATCTCIASIDNELSPIAEQLIEFCISDPTIVLSDVGELLEIEESRSPLVF